ncbi:DnaJ family domain-containing protein [Actinophytocola sp. KF-1]
MTDRKPPNVSPEDWVERQIRAAQERGEMDNLPGMGKPLPKREGGALEWAVRKLREENHDTSALLPPSLLLPKEVAALPERLKKVRKEQEVRDIVADLNKRITDVHRQPQVGPPLRLGPLDVEDVVREWRELSTGER